MRYGIRWQLNLANSGVARRVAMEMMRHSDSGSRIRRTRMRASYRRRRQWTRFRASWMPTQEKTHKFLTQRVHQGHAVSRQVMAKK